MSKKKPLNEEALAITKALSIALKLSKDAVVVTHNGYLIARTDVGTLFVPCDLTLSCAIAAADLFNALRDCTEPFKLSEDTNEVLISWGRRRARIKTMPRVSVYVNPMDSKQAEISSPTFTHALREAIKDLGTSDSSASPFLKFTNGAAFWTNGISACMISTATYMPDIIVFIKDMKSVLGYQAKDADGNDVLINGVGGSMSTVTFHFTDNVCIQIPTGDDSTIKYPNVGKLFAMDLYSSDYDLTKEHLEAVAYVADFSEKYIHIEPTHIGTDVMPNLGTAVETDDLPLQLVFRKETIKLGGFSKATKIIKAADAAASRVGFYTYRENITWCFVKVVTGAE